MKLEQFDWELYVLLSKELKNVHNMDQKKALAHWEKNGKKEGKLNSFYKQYPNFDWIIYKSLYDDLKTTIKSPRDAMIHWLKHGEKQGRTYNFYKIYPDFNWRLYIATFQDLKNANINTEKDAVHHWIINGRFEGRAGNFMFIYNKFLLFDK